MENVWYALLFWGICTIAVAFVAGVCFAKGEAFPATLCGVGTFVLLLLFFSIASESGEGRYTRDAGRNALPTGGVYQAHGAIEHPSRGGNLAVITRVDCNEKAPFRQCGPEIFLMDEVLPAYFTKTSEGKYVEISEETARAHAPTSGGEK